MLKQFCQLKDAYDALLNQLTPGQQRRFWWCCMLPGAGDRRRTRPRHSCGDGTQQRGQGARNTALYDELNRVKWLLSDAERETINSILDKYLAQFPQDAMTIRSLQRPEEK